MIKKDIRLIYMILLIVGIIIIYAIMYFFNNDIINNIIILLFCIFVIISTKIIIKIHRKRTYFQKKAEFKNFHKRSYIIRLFKNYIYGSFEKIYDIISEKEEIENYIFALKQFLKKSKTLNPKNFYSFKFNLIKILKDIHPFEYYITHTQREIMRIMFKTYLDKIFPVNIENLYKFYKTNKSFPKANELLKIGSIYMSIVNLDLIYEKLEIGNIDELVNSFMKFKNIPILKLFLSKSKEEDLRRLFENIFSSDELKKRESHYLKDLFTNYQDIFSKYELIKKYFGYLLEIESNNFNIQTLNTMEFFKGNKLMDNLKNKFNDNRNWDVFFDLGEKRKKDIRNLKAHQELKIENGIIVGWLNPLNPPLTIQEFNKNKILFIIFLWKIYEVLRIKLSDRFIDELVQF